MTPTPGTDAERIAQRFHAEYEAQAPSHGWQTQRASRTTWEHVPEENRQLMVSVVEGLLRAQVIFPGPSLYAEDTA
jgi:hypothetical protein